MVFRSRRPARFSTLAATLTVSCSALAAVACAQPVRAEGVGGPAARLAALDGGTPASARPKKARLPDGADSAAFHADEFLGVLDFGEVPAALLAQAPPPTPPESSDAELNRLFQLMLRNPTNLDIMFAYAQAAIRAGNIDAAIATLSRMLLFNPNLPRVRLELGALYFEAGSFVVAESYLREALAVSDMPAAVRERATALLTEIERRQSRSRFTGVITLGHRHQSNATFGASGIVRALGQDAVLSSQFAAQRDFNDYAIIALQHSYAFIQPGGDTIESTLTAYESRQWRLHDFNIGVYEITTGPRIGLDSLGLPGTSVRPYVIGNTVRIHDARHFYTWGGGISVRQPIGERLSAELSYERREKRYRNNAARPTATDQNSGEDGIQLSVQYSLTPDIILGLIGNYAYEEARRDFRANWRAGATVTGTLFYDPGVFATTEPWTLNLAATRGWTRYRAPDDAVDPDVTRRDMEWRFGALNTVPLPFWSGLSLFAQAQYTRYQSNLPNFVFENYAYSGGLSWRF